MDEEHKLALITEDTFLSANENMHQHSQCVFSCGSAVACCQRMEFTPTPALIPSAAKTSSFFCARDPFHLRSTAMQREVTFKWPQLAIEAALHLATGRGLFPFITVTQAQNEDPQRTQTAVGRLMSAEKMLKRCLLFLSLFSAAMTSLCVIKGTLEDGKSLHHSSTYFLQGPRLVLQASFLHVGEKNINR